MRPLVAIVLALAALAPAASADPVAPEEARALGPLVNPYVSDAAPSVSRAIEPAEDEVEPHTSSALAPVWEDAAPMLSALKSASVRRGGAGEPGDSSAADPAPLRRIAAYSSRVAPSEMKPVASSAGATTGSRGGVESTKGAPMRLEGTAVAGRPASDSSGLAPAMVAVAFAIFVLLVALAARFGGDIRKLLAQPTRARVLAAIAAKGAANAHELARELGVHYTTIVHHLRKLERAGSVVRVEGAVIAYRLPGDAKAAEVARTMSRGTDFPNRLLATVRESPGLSRRAAARALGVDPTHVRYHARKLVEAGLLKEVVAPEATRLYAA